MNARDWSRVLSVLRILLPWSCCEIQAWHENTSGGSDSGGNKKAREGTEEEVWEEQREHWNVPIESEIRGQLEAGNQRVSSNLNIKPCTGPYKSKLLKIHPPPQSTGH